MTVRLTVHPGEDVELADAATPAAFREPLAALVRRPELRQAPLLADGVPVPDGCAAGERPLLPGATLTVRGRPSGSRERPSPRTSRVPWWRPRGRHGTRRILEPPRHRPDARWLLGLLPVAASVGLAIALRQPVLAVFALAGLAAALPPLFRRGRPDAGASRRHRGGPDALLAFATAAHRAAPGTWRDARHAWQKHGDAPPGWPGGHWADVLADHTVAVVGPPGPARGVARALVAELVVHGRPVRVLGATRPWAWCRWLGPAGPTVPSDTMPSDAAPTDGAPVLVVDHGTPEDLAAARRAVAGGAAVVVIGTTDACRTVLTVRDRRLHVTGPDLRDGTRPLLGVTAAWADRFARRLAGARHLGRTVATLTGRATPPVPGLPDDVPLTALHTPDALSWAVPLGRDATGQIDWDLVADGPHLLVAGTTGSGKSELLRALVVGLARRHPPERLVLGLVDFKGGAGLGDLTGLPHVAGQVTDLDAGLGARALTGLQAELRRRKAVLAAHRVTDVAALPQGVLPRLVVVVDEFRALADDLPDFVPGLVRVAAQGRSLGVHLVLATQRPAGAVSADVRANVTTRIALRVTDPAESRDVVDCPDAAHLPVDRPGRAVLRIGAGPPVTLQCARTGSGPSPALVSRAVPFGRPGPRPPGTTAPAPDPDTVDAIRSAWAAPTAVAPLWLPPLPARVVPADVEEEGGSGRSGGLVLALGDLPQEQRRAVIRWDPAEGNLAVIGRTRSGRSTALAALAAAAHRRGMTTRLVVPDDVTPGTSIHGAPGYPVGSGAAEGVPEPLVRAERQEPFEPGDPAGPGDPGDPAARPDLLLVDDLDALRAARPGWQPPADVPVAFTTRSVAAVHAGRAGPRLVLLSRDRHDDVALGAPAALAGAGGLPGRAAWCDGRTSPVLCQVVLP